MILQNNEELKDTTAIRVIHAIHENWANGRPFALRDVVAKTEVSKASVIRALQTLLKAKLLLYSKQANAGRHYSVTKDWPNAKADAISKFMYVRILKL